jgi:hypothetical protein
MLGITLKQLKNGKWKAGGRALKFHSVIIEEDTPDKALAAAKRYLDFFEEIMDHCYGFCNPETCGTCKTDKEESRQTRGIRTGNRPRRYDAKEL